MEPRSMFPLLLGVCYLTCQVAAKARIRDSIAKAICLQVAAYAQTGAVQLELKKPPIKVDRSSRICILWDSCSSSVGQKSTNPCPKFSKNVCHAVNNRHGEKALRIINGETAKPHEFPYHLAIGLKFIDNTTQQQRYNYHCGATPLNEYYVLTAAHCIQNFSLEDFVVMGARHDIKRDFLGVESHNENTEPNAQYRDAERIIIHEKYPLNMDAVQPNDIGLIKLKSPLEFNEYVQPITLPYPKYLATGEVLLAGWGYDAEYTLPRFLNKVVLTAISDKECRNIFATSSAPYYQTFANKIVDSIMCIAIVDGRSSCGGDSGSSMVIKNGTANVVVGLVSWGFGCGTEGMPSGATEVAYFVDWIRAHMRDPSTKCRRMKG